MRFAKCTVSADEGAPIEGPHSALLGHGQHKVLVTRARLHEVELPTASTNSEAAASRAEREEEEGCLLWLEYALPQELFVDPDKTHELGISQKSTKAHLGAPGEPLLLSANTTFMPSCQGISSRGALPEAECRRGPVMVNVELPSYSPLIGPPPLVRQEVFIRRSELLGGVATNMREVEIQLPVHLRYGQPCSGSCNGLLAAAAAPPLVGIACAGAPPQQLEAAAAKVGQGLLHFTVPVGRVAHWNLVVAFSGLAALGGLLSVVYALSG
ncbi:uncharacterized protein LOC34617826 [Cyclospora cayetanensis]|uniref:Uncharacterized protein LOC34617826 n=1 Tax=Cyclospora cayetanensis TaxID=88456 RepID=A0A6P6S2P7_9EIME|nr:uncharacterized protein LOC34617826 [Cyclospora cayetanensis]